MANSRTTPAARSRRRAAAPPAPLLVVDADPAVASALAFRLGAACRVSAADSPREALRQIRSAPPGAIVSELEFPLSDGGGDSTDALLKAAAEAGVPVLILTRQALDAARLKQLEALGIVEALAKPAAVEPLLSRIGGLLSAPPEVPETPSPVGRSVDGRQLVADVAHEFRTPLAAVSQSCDVLREGLAGPVLPEQQQLLGAMASRIDDLCGLVDDLLDVDRLETGRLGPRRRVCHVDEIRERVEGMLSQRAEHRGVRLRWRLPPELPQVFCDPENVGRALLNLATNAIKFTPAGRSVVIWARPDEGNHSLRLGVHDRGPGIPPHHLRSVCERHVRGPQVGGEPGFGLGLDIARTLIERNLGRLDARSTPGRGSTFWFTLPLDEPRRLFDRWLARTAANGARRVAVLSISATGTTEPEGAEMGTRLQELLPNEPLVYGVRPDRWLIAAPCDNEAEYLHRLRETCSAARRDESADPLPEISGRLLAAADIDGAESLPGIWCDGLSPRPLSRGARLQRALSRDADAMRSKAGDVQKVVEQRPRQ